MAAEAAAEQRRLPFNRRVMLFLAVLGPGLITASVDNDAGGITTYSVAGATWGYDLLWTLIPITVALVVVQEMSARMGVVTGKGLSDLIRENFGVRITFWMSIALIVANLGNVVAEFAGVAASLQIFGVPVWLSVPAAALAVWLLVLKGTYRSVEKFFLVASLFYIAYPITLFFAKPDWGEIGTALVVPRLHSDGAYIAMLIGMVGTTIAPWMQFYLQAAVVEKGIKPEQYGMSRLDVIAGCIVTDVVAFAIVVACAATLHVAGVRVHPAALHRLLRLRGLRLGVGRGPEVRRGAAVLLALHLDPGDRRRGGALAEAAAHPHHAGVAGAERHAAALHPGLHAPPHQQGEVDGQVAQRPLVQRRGLDHHRGDDPADRLAGGHQRPRPAGVAATPPAAAAPGPPGTPSPAPGTRPPPARR
jgi:hypothetical protein